MKEREKSSFTMLPESQNSLDGTKATHVKILLFERNDKNMQHILQTTLTIWRGFQVTNPELDSKPGLKKNKKIKITWPYLPEV